MSRSFLAAIRSAVSTAPETNASQEDQPGAVAPSIQAPSGANLEVMMSDDPKPGQTASGISQANLDAAVEAARAEGHAAGIKACSDRFSAVLSAEGIKGNPTRIGASLDLAIKSPGMSVEDVTSFVTANVSAAAPSSLASRIAAADQADALASPSQPAAASAKVSWDAAFKNTPAN